MTVYTEDFGDALDTTYWTTVDADSLMTITGGLLSCYATGTPAKASVIDSTFMLTGDFDIQIDFSNCSYSSTSGIHYAALHLFENGRFTYGAVRGRSATFNGYARQERGVWVEYSKADASGKLRITRSGSVVKMYMWSGSQWEWNGSSAGTTCSTSYTTDLSVRISFYQASGSTAQISFDNLVINTGSMIWPSCGWNDSFTGDDGDAPDPIKWAIGNGTPDIQSNKLQETAVVGDAEYVDGKVLFTGDFDVQVDLYPDSLTAVDISTMSFFAIIDATHRYGIGYEYNGGWKWRRYYQNGGASLDTSYYESTTAIATFIKLRLVRVGTTVTAYGKHAVDTNWNELDSGIDIGDGDIYFQLVSYTTSATVIASWDNFIVVSGCSESYLSSLTGSARWGHETGVTQDNARTFAGNWTGTGTISGSGDAETLTLDTGEYEIGEVVNTGIDLMSLSANYGTGETNEAILLYRTSDTEEGLDALEWVEYTAPFMSEGYVQTACCYGMDTGDIP